MALESGNNRSARETSIDAQKRRIGGLEDVKKNQLNVVHSKIDNIVSLVENSAVTKERKREMLKAVYDRLKTVIEAKQLTMLSVDLASKLAELRLAMAGRKIESLKKSAEAPIKMIKISSATLIDNYNKKIPVVGVDAAINHLETILERTTSDYMRRCKIARSEGHAMKPPIKMSKLEKRSVHIYKLQLLASKMEKTGRLELKPGQYLRDSKLGWYVAIVTDVKNGKATLDWLNPPKKTVNKKSLGRAYMLLKEAASHGKTASGAYREINYEKYYKQLYGSIYNKKTVDSNSIQSGNKNKISVVNVDHDMGRIRSIKPTKETTAYKEYKKFAAVLQKQILQDSLQNTHFEVKHQLKNYLAILGNQLMMTKTAFRLWQNSKDDKSVYGFTKIGAAIGSGSMKTKDIYSDKYAEWGARIVLWIFYLKKAFFSFKKNR